MRHSAQSPTQITVQNRGGIDDAVPFCDDHRNPWVIEGWFTYKMKALPTQSQMGKETSQTAVPRGKIRRQTSTSPRPPEHAPPPPFSQNILSNQILKKFAACNHIKLKVIAASSKHLPFVTGTTWYCTCLRRQIRTLLPVPASISRMVLVAWRWMGPVPWVAMSIRVWLKSSRICYVGVRWIRFASV